MPVTRLGLIRVHGPVLNRCPGSRKPGHLILKLDFRNAFNCLHRDMMIAAVKQLAPELLPLVTCAYSTPSFLFWGRHYDGTLGGSLEEVLEDFSTVE